MKFEYNSEKDVKLLAERKIGFEAIIRAVILTDENPNQAKYPNQEAFYVELGEKIYVVPFAQKDSETIFLKTIFPSRKARKKFLSKKTKKVRTKKF